MPKSPSIWFSKFGDKKAGTSRSHDIGRYESKLINQDHTKTSRKPNKQTKNKKTQRFRNLVTSPKVRVGVETCFFWFGLITGLINLGGVETDQSVDVPKTCFCEETCYRKARNSCLSHACVLKICFPPSKCNFQEVMPMSCPQPKSPSKCSGNLCFILINWYQ